ncbi:TerC family protein [Thermoactinomyces intermedius]|uniref:TerC family protein n=2 Tax=Thermoactinomycetaceae TaxID=186824 RepID=A0A8I1DDQ7_THEIN|nr:TerC family protein [Thermoactinomyces intermedius]MBA4836277.1 TerC family protein [Thermoactinomyces intermedius]MBH8594134.1 TerC family protein [Thermoactinomyces intermedius]MBH8600970.1 TerC family protein [Thermoactinomyces sp. CICC 23799]
MEPAFWLAFFNIIIIDLILSGDNAVVIGMAARKLPPAQRKKAIVFGAGVAVLLRSTLTVVAAYLLNIPLLKTVGGILLIGIAVKLLVEEDDGVDVHAGDTLKSAIKTIIIADVVMSLDNVLAVAGASHGSVFLVLIGLALSIPFIMWGSNIIAGLLNRFPWLLYVGAAVLGYTGGQLIVEDPFVHQLLTGLDVLNLIIPVALAVIVVISGYAWKHKTKTV